MSPPKPPNATDTSNTQLGFNQEAAKLQNAGNLFNQQTPYGSQDWTADPNSPSGYSGSTTLTPAQQQLLDIRQGTQTNTGSAAQGLSSNFGSLYGAPPDLSAQTGQTAGLLNSWQQQYLQPIFNQQQSNTSAQLNNQGITQGSQAYNNAQNLLARNQGDITNQYLSMNEPTAFNQAIQQYQLPMQTEAGLLGQSSPQGPNFQSTPTSQIQPPNYQQAAQQQYANNYQQYGAAAGGIGSIAGTLLSAGLSPGGFGGMFGGGSGSASSLGWYPSNNWFNN